MTHVEEERLLAFTLGQLDGDSAREVEAHLASCADCKRAQESLSSGAFSKTAVGSKDGHPTRVEGTGSAASGAALQRGATLGRYVLLEKLGAGGMGEVFAAYDPQLDRKVALKLLRTGALSAEEGRARLLREAQAMARLQHPNVIAVHDVGVLGERVFIAMEYVEGETLADWLRGQRDWKEVIRLFLQAGSGLASAHRAGLVHRDFKPDNVLIGVDHRPRVLDFGLARQSNATPAPQSPEKALTEALSDSSLAIPLTRDGAVMGTPGYMPPEQISGLATDARSDQFSFCVALWEALYGKRPFAGSTLRQLAQEIEARRFGPVPSDNKVPEWVAVAVKKGLSANPADRWPDMDALLRELRPRARTRPRVTLFAVGLVLFSIFGIGYGVWTRQRLLVCGGSEQRLAGTWDTARKAKLRAGFAATGLSYANEAWLNTERTLDAWAAEWVVTARDVCEASKLRQSDSAELTELKNGCLDERLQRLESLVALFDAPDHDVVNSAPSAARDLESATSCSTSTGHRRKTVDEKEKAADVLLHTRLADARALFAAGKYAAGAEKLKQGLDPSAPAGSQAEAYLWLGRLEIKRGEPRLAHQANLTAAEQALKAGESALAARALSRLYANEGFDEAGDADADAWNRLATAAAARVPGDWEVEVELSQNEGFVELRRKRYKAALADFERVLVLQQEHLGAEHPEVASTLNNLGVVLSRLERLDEAVRRYEESLQLHEKLEGPEHPNVAAASQNLAVALKRQGKSRLARAAFERAVALRRKALGFNHPDTLRSAQSLVKLLIAMGELEAAGSLLEEVKEAKTLVHGADSAELLSVLELEADLYLSGEYWKEALDAATRHLTLARAKGAAGTRDVAPALLEQLQAWAQLGAWADARKAVAELQRRVAAADSSVDEGLLAEALGRLELAQGHATVAVPELERAVELREKAGPLGASRTRALLARALMETGRAEEAIPLLAEAETQYAQAESTRWLIEAQVLKAQATWLAREEERPAAVALLRELMSKVPEGQQPALAEWLEKH
jgi:tRNA A-37 threonylcarbamoyl transferase component Bud32/Flp pilus assembly protein TadD